ncbi:hypothetical protein [Leuconostoc mesenteroides]|uniref:hypothetical protein n=1 Tax=Leuconostoc mesenteroides TaxID=1245 RepID=UPI00235E4D9C|nr:hypothetical protein [Leuconostoc mesenteroides]
MNTIQPNNNDVINGLLQQNAQLSLVNAQLESMIQQYKAQSETTVEETEKEK